MGPREAAAAAVFAATFLLLALGRVGRLHVPRGWAALAGGLLTAALLRVSWRAIDLQVILLLAGLMALAGLCEAAGVVAGLRRRLLSLHPGAALGASLATVGLASALLLNDAAVVVLVPLLLPVLVQLGLDAVAAVTLMAVAANVGSLLTPFGNPQNAALASAAGLGVADFLAVQGPVVAVGAVLLAAAAFWHGRRAAPRDREPPPPLEHRGRPLALAGVAVFLALAAAGGRWGIGLGTAAAAGALVAIALLVPVLGRGTPRAVARTVDANVLLLFVGLYLLTGGLPQWFPEPESATQRLDGPWSAALGVSVLSNVVGNVPAVLTLLKLDPEWTVGHAPFLVTVSTLGGALLLTGSAASLLAADAAKRCGTEVRFLPFLCHAAPWVLPPLLLGVWWTW